MTSIAENIRSIRERMIFAPAIPKWQTTMTFIFGRLSLSRSIAA